LSTALPDAEPLVREITDSYVHYRFSRAEETIDLLPQSGEPALWQTWKQLETIFWQAWRRTVGQRLLRRTNAPQKPDPLSLTPDKSEEQ
jgi:hypothetical protein